MRIVNAMFGRGRGGLEQVFLDYCDALLAAGHEVVALIHPDAAIRPALDEHRVAYHTIANRNAWDPVATLRLRSWIKYVAPDVTLAHGNRAISLLRLAGCRPLIGVAANYTLKGGGLDAILCPTEDLARHCRAHGFAAGRISVVPHAVSVPEAGSLAAWRETPVIGAMGRFVEKKGFHVLIEALRLLREQGLSFRAVVAGAGAEEQVLKRLAMESGLADLISFPGWQDDIGAFFNSIDVFCLPSLHEPFGIVLIEAMAHAVPVIASASEGPSEIVHNGEDGVIVPKDDPGALASAIGRLLEDRATAQVMAQRGRQTVEQTYSMARLSARLDEALRAAVS